MGTFSSGTGLISGFDIEGYVTQIMEIESQNKVNYEERVEDNTYEQDVLKAIQAKVMSVQLKAANFNTYSTFENKNATSSAESVMTATAQTWATRGSYQFVVKSLATNHQIVTRNSFSSREETVGSGTISFEIGQGQLTRDMDVTLLNGRTGFQRGKIEITDKAGNTDIVDLTTALSVNDILKAINSSEALVKASVSGDGIVIEDLSGGTGNLIVEDIDEGQTAADLGILQTTSGSKITGEDIVSISRFSLLKELNDGNGIRDLTTSTFNIKGSSSDFDVTLSDKISETNTLQSLNSGAGVRLGKFEITDRNGQTAIIDLSGLSSSDKLSKVEEIIKEQAEAANLDLTINYTGRNNIQIIDNSERITGDEEDERRSNFIIKDLEGGSTAADLGIEADTSSGTISGDTIWKMDTLADVMAAINYNSANYKNERADITVSIDPDSNQLKVVDNNSDIFAPQNDRITITAGEDDGLAAYDLGLLTGEDGVAGSEFQGRALVAGLNTVLLSSLNGGSGGDPTDENYGENRIISGGIISIKDGSSNTAVEVDLSDAISVQDVLDAINDAGTNITAEINSVGNGITLKDSSGTGQMVIADVDGDLAAKLNLAGGGVDEISSGNLQLQYISEATLLDDMRNGQGITRGTFTITDSSGVSKEINLSQDKIKTVGDVIAEINNAGNNIRAKVNSTGDGIMLYDISESQTDSIKVIDSSAGTASDLGLMARDAVKDENGNYYINGSFELTLNLGGSDSLNDISSMINESGLGIDSSVVFDGVGYHLSFSSEISGRKGTIYFDAGETEMAVDNVTSARDAIILLGDGSEDHPMLISNDTNSIKDAILGTTLELQKVSDEAVTVNVTDDVDNMVEELNSFIDSYNEVLDLIAQHTQFNTDTYEKGILFSDHTTSMVKNQLLSLIQQTFSNLSGDYRSFASIGISLTNIESETVIDEDGNEVTTIERLNAVLDEDIFRSAFEEEPDAVTALFNTKDAGISDYVNDLLDNLASSSAESSTMQNRIDAISNSNSLLEDRIEDLEERLSEKEARLYSQFYAMEETLAQLQSQQSAITSLSAS